MKRFIFGSMKTKLLQNIFKVQKSQLTIKKAIPTLISIFHKRQQQAFSKIRSDRLLAHKALLKRLLFTGRYN
jgi:hypothetical protein